ncbi:uncharacterized protein LOC131536103 [Onychostoma macrolepis]|uniref:Ig-like domain-containing protein n=1 Tax=Onychostoma macrolepis TaxID=369639 RepID=A0A7J6DBM5_9TELE|nr:uncharacterized protein LOC131536103 [Onychostoma macrolepis]KAF4116541.1 hypothetical protein G5714_004030 [Onychostoma macrolepis]
MAEKFHLCLLGLIFLSSLLTGSSGVNDAHVFISSGENVRLRCNNVLHDCKSTTWVYDRFSHSAAVELLRSGIKNKDTDSHERLILGSDCSLNIKNVTKEDYGLYICQQWTVNGQKLRTDARVYLHVLHVSSSSSSSSSSSQTEISAGRSVTLSCQLYSLAGVSCDDLINSEGIELFWVNQAGVKLINSDSRYQESAPDHCISTLNTTLLNEDHNREWRCEVSHKNQAKTSATYTVKSSAQDKTTTAVNPVHITNSQDLKTKARAASMTAVIPVHITNSQNPSTTNTHITKDPAETEVSRTARSLFRVILIILETAAFAAPTVILLQIICARRAGRKNSQHLEEI